MGVTAKRSFDLSAEQADFIDRKVASGEFASADALIEEGIRALQEREVESENDPDLERFIREQVVPTYEQLKADPSSVIPAREMRRRLRNMHERNVGAKSRG